MKKIFIFLILLMLTALLQISEAGILFDDFNDGNTDGWISEKPGKWNEYGNWRLEDGVIVEDFGRDNYMFLSDTYSVSSQSVEADIFNYDTGAAGITVWYQDMDNWVQVFAYRSDFAVAEVIDGYGIFTTYSYEYSVKATWHTLEVDANSLTGELIMNLNGDHIATHTVTTENRTGLSGFNSRNAGGKFDNFKLTSNDIVVVPEPISSTLFIVGGATLGFRRFRKRK